MSRQDQQQATSDGRQECRDSSLSLVAGRLSPGAPRRILIIGLSNIGDAILMSPIVSRVHEAFPDAHVTLVVGERAKMVFADDPRVHALVDADQFRDGLGRVRLAWALWRYHPQVVVDLRHTLYPLLLVPSQAWRYLLQPPRAIAHMRERHLWKLHAQVPQLRQSPAWAEGSSRLRKNSPLAQGSRLEAEGKNTTVDGARGFPSSLQPRASSQDQVFQQPARFQAASSSEFRETRNA